MLMLFVFDLSILVLYLQDTSEQNLILSIFREMKKLYESSVKPLEMIYKYRHITTRLIT